MRYSENSSIGSYDSEAPSLNGAPKNFKWLDHAAAKFIKETGGRSVSLTAWSREGENIVSTLRLKSLREQEMIIPLQIKMGTEQFKIGDASLLVLTEKES
jgi:hypothetical protein